ncbi:hypothetical protein [Flaviaesturariibacter amylovorans]|uniref:DUF4134 domain-containing protein n=1 Tax=Flaviaesturariibacter amylovorans TaxID=1084520 RepID=A0ABP8HJS0_9BACT
MKALLLLICMFLCCAGASAQLADSTAPARGTAAWHLGKARSQKTAAWILLGGGTLVGVIGLGNSINMSGGYLGPASEEEKSKQRVGEVMFLVGGAAVLGSVPLFLAGARNKRIALGMKRQASYLPDPGRQHSFAALSLRLPI